MRTTYPDNPKQKPHPGPQRSQRATHPPTGRQPTPGPPIPPATSPLPGRQPAPGRQHIRIGNQHPDTLITYPDAHNLSGCAQPIRITPNRSHTQARDTTNERPTHRRATNPLPGHHHHRPPSPRATSPPRAADTTGRRQRDTAPAPAATPYNPRNALIAGISRTAWTRPAR